MIMSLYCTCTEQFNQNFKSKFHEKIKIPWKFLFMYIFEDDSEIQFNQKSQIFCQNLAES